MLIFASAFDLIWQWLALQWTTYVAYDNEGIWRNFIRHETKLKLDAISDHQNVNLNCARVSK